MAQCIICGKDFEEKPYKVNKYCSGECYHQAQRTGFYQWQFEKKIHEKNKRICEICGISFVASASKKRNGEEADHVFCSRRCYLEYHKEKLYRHTCKYCGKEFEKPRALGRNTHEFCNDMCRRSYFAQKTLKHCEVCGQAFYPWAHENTRDIIILDKEVRTCSKKCRKILHQRNEAIRRDKISIAFSGEKHPNWSGGQNRYRGKNWARQKRLALIRDNYTCQKCGITRAKCVKKYHRSPNVHHIKPYRFFNSYEEANLLDNLITLCDGCHQKEEWEYRKKYHEEYEKQKLKS